MKEPLDIKLFVSCHQPGQTVPPHPLLVPIQVGARWQKQNFPILSMIILEKTFLLKTEYIVSLRHNIGPGKMLRPIITVSSTIGGICFQTLAQIHRVSIP